MLKLAIRLIIFLLPLFTVGQTSTYIENLKSTDKEEKSNALQKLIEIKDVSSFPVLNAIKDKKLFVFENKLVTIGKKETTDNGNVYQLLHLFPDEKPLLSNDKKPVLESLQNLRSIKFSRKDRLAIVPLASYINLSSSNIDIRKFSYTQFQNSGTYNDLPILEAASFKETDPELIRAANETILFLKLRNEKNPNKQIAIIDALSANKGDNTIVNLSKYLENNSPSEKVKDKVSQEISSLESRATRISWLQNLFSGLSLGSILILISLGLAIIYGLAGVINMAHGEFMMIGAYTTFCTQELLEGTALGGDSFFWFSIPISFFVAGVFGLIIERLIIRKLYGNPLESLLATWGVSLVFIQLARTVFGDLTSVKAPKLLSGGWQAAPQLVLPYNRIFIIGITILMIVLTFFFLYKSRYGLRIRSVTQNRNMSACLGISTKKIDAITFFIGSGIAGIAGCCMTLIGNIVPDMGQTYIVDSFLVVVTGGVGNLMGTIVAGLGIGQLTKALEPIFHAVYGKVIILGIIIFFLQFKPKGLFPPKGRIADD